MKEQIKVILVVNGDIVTDRRVLRIADTLYKEHYRVTVLSRKVYYSIPNPQVSFAIKRMHVPFKRGMLLYITFNIFVFFYLLFSKVTIITANDLDTLPACSLVAIIRRKKLLYDSHELFTELPELIDRPFKKYIWNITERICIRCTDAISTVSESIALEFEARYHRKCWVVRNFPPYCEGDEIKTNNLDKTKVLLYQGALNKGRGLETMILAMKLLPEYNLEIAGTGYLERELHTLVADNFLEKRVLFHGQVSPMDLKAVTLHADLGLSLEENMCMNYKYALPNKLFDYIQARVPVLVSDLPEMKRVVQQYNVGTYLVDNSPETLALTVKQIFANEKLINEWKINCELAAKQLCWECEQKVVISIYKDLLASNE